MNVRDRVVELQRVRAGDLQPHPRNFRTHPARQRAALRGVLEEIGFADALLARRLAEGGLQLIAGHLRRETTPDAVVPVLVLDLDEREADKLLATLDPLAAWAEHDAEALADLLERVETASDDVAALLADLARDACYPPPAADTPEPPLRASYQLVVECDDVADQQALFERLTREGRACRVLTLAA